VHHLGHKYLFKILPYPEVKNITADMVVSFWWKGNPEILTDNNIKRSILCMYDHYTWTANDHDAFDFELALRDSNILAVANEQLANKMRARGYTDKPIYIVEDGVNTELFTRPPSFPPRLTLGWCGNSRAGRGEIKGLHIIQEACKEADVDLVIADLQNKLIPHEEMPSWYASIGAYICASTMEGTPNPPLEAMACGRPVLTTRCGIMPRVVVDGANGYFIMPEVESIVNAINKLRRANVGKMGIQARMSAMAHSWMHKIPAWEACLDAGLLS
jgi:hypothetical protein